MFQLPRDCFQCYFPLEDDHLGYQSNSLKCRENLNVADSSKCYSHTEICSSHFRNNIYTELYHKTNIFCVIAAISEITILKK